MNKNWPTEDQDLYTAQMIMEDYAKEQNIDSLGVFELVLDPAEKKVDFRLSAWVTLLAKHFTSLYGETQGDYVTRQIITRCITKGQTIH